MKVKIIALGVTDNDSILDIGTVADYADSDALRLVEAGYAEAIEEEEERNDDQNGDDQGQYNEGETADKAELLHNRFTVPELVALAGDHGVDLSGITKKDEIIAKIVEAGKADAMLA